MTVRVNWMRVEVESLPSASECLACGRSVPPTALGDFVAAVIAESEFLGVVGACCLSKGARAEQVRLNGTRVSPR
jgi:hypothetical protein